MNLILKSLALAYLLPLALLILGSAGLLSYARKLVTA
jgi:hypothetical protein